jgi:hypothetical protein
MANAAVVRSGLCPLHRTVAPEFHKKKKPDFAKKKKPFRIS